MARYNKGIGLSSNCVAELGDLRDGLLLIQNSSLLVVLNEVDAMIVFYVISNPSLSYSTHAYNLLEDCMKLLALLGNLTIRHIYKETNEVVD